MRKKWEKRIQNETKPKRANNEEEFCIQFYVYQNWDKNDKNSDLHNIIEGRNYIFRVRVYTLQHCRQRYQFLIMWNFIS